MANLAQRFIWIELACGNSRTLAHTSEQTGRIDEIRPPRPDEREYVVAARDWLSAESITLVLGVAIGLAFVASFVLLRDTQLNGTIDKAVTKALVERIIIAESNGDANARNKRSSATGAAQFVDDTWLEAIRRHRRDLMAGRSKKEVLELRRDPELTREIAAQLIDEYAAMLDKRGLPITPGSLYLAHFAGPAGAVALLSGAENADAASLMATADTTGRTTREKIVNANPFLKVLTAGDIKRWADRKMTPINSPGRL
ncbi:lytic transglycosylase domain-containing protein [Nitrobacter vulgaris]|uniref:lytic transglycosylase domain-containing protein n=1 Tax=Nitrobacter vulgaris TaxID=29421 RepID=UPI001FCD706E|nr:lytic transglycosylase domain-containing protein [Nitrobacter vulgaris]